MTFDLKGSTANRRVKTSDESYFRQDKCLKDLNFLQINKFYHNALLYLSKDDHCLLRQAIIADSEFLCKHNIMDYSLLAVIEKSQSQIIETSDYKTSYLSANNHAFSAIDT